MRLSRFGLAVDGVVALAMAAAACGGETDGGSETSMFPAVKEESSFACRAPLPSLFSGLRPGTPVDYLELRTQRGGILSDAGAPVPGPESTGAPCTTTECRQVLEAPTTRGWTISAACNPGWYELAEVVWSRGETAGRADTAEALAALLAPIDTPEEARMMLVASRNIDLTCDRNEAKSGWRTNADGSFEILAVYGACPTRRGRFRIDPSGTVTVLEEQKGTEDCVCGRRFDGLVASGTGGSRRSLVAYLEEVAHLEAASVIAFRRFEKELRRLGAPKALLRRARASRWDEIRHARMTAWLAKVHGGVVAPVEASPERTRAVFEIALENAVEGCVRETYGALVAAYQARNAKDPELRRAMQIIAVDEAKHAELAHDVAAWLDALLTRGERERIDAAKIEALRELEDASAISAASEVREAAGVPGPLAARELVRGILSLSVARPAA